MSLSEAINFHLSLPVTQMKYSILVLAGFSILAIPFVAHAQEPRPPRLTTVTEERYRLQPGDVLELKYRYLPAFNQTVTVQPDEYVTLEDRGDLQNASLAVYQKQEEYVEQDGKGL